MNVTFLGSAIEKERLLATEFLAVSWLGGCGLVMRALFDYMPVRNIEGQIIRRGLTSTEYETKNIGGLGSAFMWFGVAFGLIVWAIWAFSEYVLLTIALTYGLSGPLGRILSRIRPQPPAPEEVHAS